MEKIIPIIKQKQKKKEQKIESPLINKNNTTTNNIIQEQTSSEEVNEILYFMVFGIQINIILNYLCGQKQMVKILKKQFLV